MSIPIETSARKTVSIVRRRTTQDGSGNPTLSETTLATGVVCDIQPLSGTITDLLSGAEPGSTHTLYPLSRISASLKPGDVVVDGSTELELLFVHDYTGAHQELDLRLVSGDE